MNEISYLLIFIILFYLFFNRTPDRLSFTPKNIIVSPTDGRVLYAKDRIISIFLNPFDVHVQYTPIDSVVRDIIEIDGNYNLANTPDSDHNAGIKVIFDSLLGPIEVTQRVGFFVRRIQNHISIGEKLKRSQKYGKINFGSRIDILLPENIKTTLKKGDYVWGGETIIIYILK